MLKKIGFSLFLLFALSALAYGQLPNITEPDWQEFAPADEEFTVRVPVAMSPIGSQPKDVKNRMYMAQAGDIYFYAFSDEADTPFYSHEVFRFAGASADIKQPNRVFKFTDSFGWHHRLVTMQEGKRAYTFQALTVDEKYLPQIDRYIAEIKIKTRFPKLKENQNPDSSGGKIDAVQKSGSPNSAGDIGSGSGNGIGTGSGSGNGIGSGGGIGSGIVPGRGNTGQGSGIGPGAPANSQTPKSQNSGIKILSKPRPSYTDYARFYQITGVVRVRITFLAKGEIGTVTPVNKLPFGLTETALSAAKQITFEPAINNGAPISVTKMVEYSFTIY